jgi:membrane protease subunit HflC
MRGDGDAASTEFYTGAYGGDEEFYAFYRSLEAYGNAFGGSQDVMVIDKSSGFFDYFGSEAIQKP